MTRYANVLLAVLAAACGAEPASSGPDAGAADAGASRELRWVSVPAGSVEMGCSPADSECPSYEVPVHAVSIAAFEITETEITQAQYAEQNTGEHEYMFGACADCPADSMSWDEAAAFCKSIGGRLPSEAEWEYAARGGTDSVYGCGDDAACLEAVAWYFDNSGDRTHAVASKDANGFGLHDMLGNVWEWVEDCWHDDYSGDPPADGSAWEQEGCTYRVLRGGCWGLAANGLRVSNRSGDFPDGYTIPGPGFRCAR